MTRRRTRQLDLPFRPRGGKRAGAGRKPKGARAGVSHAPRPAFARLLPVHVTMRMAPHVYNLRSRRAFSRIGRAIGAAAHRFGVSIVQFSVQGNHVHLILEAPDTQALSRAMQGFSVRVAKALNKMMQLKGRVLGDRYHAHALRTPTEARRAVAYVRNNHRKHMRECGRPLRQKSVVAIPSYDVVSIDKRQRKHRGGAAARPRRFERDAEGLASSANQRCIVPVPPETLAAALSLTALARSVQFK